MAERMQDIATSADDAVLEELAEAQILRMSSREDQDTTYQDTTYQDTPSDEDDKTGIPVETREDVGLLASATQEAADKTSIPVETHPADLDVELPADISSVTVEPPPSQVQPAADETTEKQVKTVIARPMANFAVTRPPPAPDRTMSILIQVVIVLLTLLAGALLAYLVGILSF